MTVQTAPIILSEDAFTIEGHGVAVLSGIQSRNPCPFAVGDLLTFCDEHYLISTARPKAIEYARKDGDDEYGLIFNPDELDAGQILKGCSVHSAQTLLAGRDTASAIEWTGDLNDDCTAIWGQLMLRAEEMDEGDWWWAVYDRRLGNVTVGSSNLEDASIRSGVEARERASECACAYLSVTPES